MKLFVYGTLKSGYGNNALLRESELVGKTTITNRFYLVDLGPFPAAVPSDEYHEIVGEVWEIDDKTLKNTDYLEGYPNFYDRSIVQTEYGDAWMYHFTDLPDRHKDSRVVAEWSRSRG